MTLPARSRPLAARLALVSTVLAACLQPAGAREQPVGKPVEHGGYFAAYPTGLRLVVNELANAPRASVGVSWLAGSMDDPAGKEGLAHLVEHLAFRCRVGGGTVWQRLQADGAVFNAFTVHDATVYFELGKPEQLGALLSLEIQRMRDPLAGVTQADLDTEKEVVVSELRERRQQLPEFDAHEALNARLFGAGHPYARSVGGSDESVRRIAMADVKAFVERLYRPERAILTIITGRPAKEAAQLAFEELGPLATGPEDAMAFTLPPATRPKVAVPADPPRELLVLHGAVARPVVLVGFAVPGEAAEGSAMAHAAAAVLDQVLGRRLLGMGDYSKVASLGAWYSEHDGQGAIIARIELEQGIDPKDVVEALRDNLLSLQDGNADTRQRALVARQIRDSLLMSSYLSLEHLDVGDLSEYVRATGKQDAISGRQLQVLSLNQSIEAYWHEFIKRKRSAAVVVLPDPSRPAPLQAGAGLAGRMEESHAERDLPFTPRRPVEEVARPPGLDRVMRARLPNGLSVVLARRPLLPIVEAMLVIPTDLAGQGGTPRLMPEFALDFAGTAADARWMHSSRLGAQGFTSVALESLTFMRRGSAPTLPELLEDVERLTHDFEFSRSRAGLIRDFTARNLAARRTTSNGLANDAFLEAVYPNHPYGHAATPAEAEQLELAGAERWVESEVRPDLATLIVVGDVEPGPALLAKVTSIFGGWKAGRAAAPLRPPPALPGEQRVILVDRPGAKLTQLRIGLRVPTGARTDTAAAAAVALRLRQTLQETLRVDAGATYGVSARVEDRPLASTLLLQTAVDAGVSGESLVRLLAGVEALAQTPLPEEAAARVRWLVARDFSMKFDTVSQATSALDHAALRELPADYWEQQAASIASLSPARIQALAKALLGREVVMVVGDAKLVGPQLKDAGFDFERLAPPAP